MAKQTGKEIPNSVTICGWRNHSSWLTQRNQHEVKLKRKTSVNIQTNLWEFSSCCLPLHSETVPWSSDPSPQVCCPLTPGPKTLLNQSNYRSTCFTSCSLEGSGLPATTRKNYSRHSETYERINSNTKRLCMCSQHRCVIPRPRPHTHTSISAWPIPDDPSDD